MKRIIQIVLLLMTIAFAASVRPKGHDTVAIGPGGGPTCDGGSNCQLGG